MEEIRIGNFTSSNIFKLMTLAKDGVSMGAPALSYIKEKQRERRLGIEMDLDASTHALSWGRAMEGYVFQNYVDTSFALESQKTDVHPSGKWCGTKDTLSIAEETVGDIKCPFTRSSFCDLVDIIEKGSIDYFKKEEPKYFWQLVGNSILTTSKFAVLIVWMPYASEIEKCIEYVELIDDFETQRDIQWLIHTGPDRKRVPHIPNDSGYKNCYHFRFEVPETDKQLLLAKVDMAHKLLNPFKETITA